MYHTEKNKKQQQIYLLMHDPLEKTGQAGLSKRLLQKFPTLLVALYLTHTSRTNAATERSNNTEHKFTSVSMKLSRLAPVEQTGVSSAMYIRKYKPEGTRSVC